MKETFARSSVSCLTGADLRSITAVRGDPCWQVSQQLHLLIEKVSRLPLCDGRSLIVWPDAENFF